MGTYFVPRISWFTSLPSVTWRTLLKQQIHEQTTNDQTFVTIQKTKIRKGEQCKSGVTYDVTWRTRRTFYFPIIPLFTLQMKITTVKTQMFYRKHTSLTFQCIVSSFQNITYLTYVGKFTVCVLAFLLFMMSYR